jgi:serine/threonine protein kinase
MQGVSPAATKPPPPLLIGRYRLLERIGEGGMGVVWRCYDLDLEEPVAIKFLREEFAHDEVLRASFRREVKLARRVTHPNVSRVFELGRDGDHYFLTMEYVPGESLQSLLRAGSLAEEFVAAIALGLCRGLAGAHAAGIIHGDIKPANVLVAPNRGAVLTDFGISRVLSEAHLAPEDEWGGTPLFMAPEQFTSAALTVHCDIYAVGVLLFEALTGRVPWPADDMGALIQAKCGGREPDLQALAPELPPGWSELISDCLRVDPGRRPADARVLLARLAPIRGHGPRPAPRPAPGAARDASLDLFDDQTFTRIPEHPRGRTS